MRAGQLREDVEDARDAQRGLEPERTLEVDAIGGGGLLDVDDDLAAGGVARLVEGGLHGHENGLGGVGEQSDAVCARSVDTGSHDKDCDLQRRDAINSSESGFNAEAVRHPKPHTLSPIKTAHVERFILKLFFRKLSFVGVLSSRSFVAYLLHGSSRLSSKECSTQACFTRSSHADAAYYASLPSS